MTHLKLPVLAKKRAWEELSPPDRGREAPGHPQCYRQTRSWPGKVPAGHPGQCWVQLPSLQRASKETLCLSPTAIRGRGAGRACRMQQPLHRLQRVGTASTAAGAPGYTYDKYHKAQKRSKGLRLQTVLALLSVTVVLGGLFALAVSMAQRRGGAGPLALLSCAAERETPTRHSARSTSSPIHDLQSPAELPPDANRENSPAAQYGPGRHWPRRRQCHAG